MVNFGPYGDYLNSKVNDDDENNNNDRRKETKHDPNVPGANTSSGNNNKNYHSRSTNHDHVLFAHGSTNSSDDDANENDTTRIDHLYYYISSSSTSHSDTGASDDDDENGDDTTSLATANTDRTNDTTGTFSSSSSSSSSGWKRNTLAASSSSSSSPLLSSLDQLDMDMAAGTYRILQIPTRSLKPGGLRLFLIMYVLGAVPSISHATAQQQQQQRLQIWKVDRPSTEEYIIDLYYHDHSAILSIELIPAKAVDASTTDISSTEGPQNESDPTNNSGMIHIHRIGSAPSAMYRVHEATLLQGLLQELLTCATDAVSIPQIENRLLTFHNTTIAQLHSICRTLPFG
jgi:hypothetical protein